MKILLTGDYFYNYKEEKEDFHRLKSFLSSYDATILNWEGSFKEDNKSKLTKAVNLYFSSEGLNLPENSILCLSNNHVLDFGTEALNTTIKEIESKGFKWFGLQSCSKVYDNFRIIDLNGEKICFISFGCKKEECIPPGKSSQGITDFNMANIDKTFESIKNINYDLLICYCHAGYEFEYYPLPLHVGLSRYLVDSGCDFVYFSHTHTFQPYEIYKNKYIFYGLGNFYFSSLRTFYPEVCDRSLSVELTIEDKNIINVNSIDIFYDRNERNSSFDKNSDYFKKHSLGYSSLKDYSEDYSKIRTRKKNPRPIMYFNKTVSNSLKYYVWLSFVKIAGFLGIKKLLKTILRWN